MEKSNLELTRSRLNGWQQEAWDKSYAYKKDIGMSLIKKNFSNKKINFIQNIIIN